MKNKESSASKIVLDSFESLFGDQEDMGKEDRVRMIPLSELYEFAGHPFRVLDDEKMQETVESVKKYGVLVPGIARKRPQDHLRPSPQACLRTGRAYGNAHVCPRLFR